MLITKKHMSMKLIQENWDEDEQEEIKEFTDEIYRLIK